MKWKLGLSRVYWDCKVEVGRLSILRRSTFGYPQIFGYCIATGSCRKLGVLAWLGGNICHPRIRKTQEPTLQFSMVSHN